MGKVKVSNGSETLEIDGADLSAAVKDGYKPTERIIVSNSKETYEIDPNDVESALGEGFSYQDIIKKNVSQDALPKANESSLSKKEGDSFISLDGNVVTIKNGIEITGSQATEDEKKRLPQQKSNDPIKPTKDLLTLARERKEAQARINTYTAPTQTAAPGGYVARPDIEPSKKQLAESNEAIKALGGDEQLADDIWDIPQGKGFSFIQDIPGLMKLRTDNKNAYNRELGAIKSKGNLYNAIRDKSDVNTANELIQGLQATEKQNYRAGVQEGIDLVRKYIDDTDEQNKVIKNLIVDKSYDYGIQTVAPDERFASMNPYQQRAMQFLEDVDKPTFNAYQKILSVNPDEQWMGSKEGDIRRGHEMKGKELENIGMNLQVKAYEEKLTNLKNKQSQGQQLTPQEQQDYDKTLADYQLLTKDKEGQRQRYPTQAVVESDQLMQEALGNKNSIAKKFALGVGENFDDAVNWVGDLFQNQGVAGDLELLGDKQSSELNRYTNENDKLIGSDFVAKFSPELQKQIDDIKNSNKSDEQKQDQVRELILNNQNKINYVANDKAGKSNFTAKAIMNTVGDVASDLVSQIAIAYLSGGAGATTKLGELSSLFGSTFATAYNDYYNEALQKNIPNPTQYATVHTSIEAASELINPDFDAVKRIIGKSGTLGKVINSVTKEEFESIAKKGLFSKIKDAALQTGKSTLRNAFQETGEEVAGQLAGNIADQKIFNKETGVGEGVKDTFIQTMVGMLPLGLLSLPFNYQNINRNQKYAMYEAGMNPGKFIQAIDADLQAGTITTQQAQERKENVQRAAQAVKSSTATRTDGTPMTDNEKTEYAFNQSVLQEIKEQKKDAPDAIKEKLEKEEEKLDMVQSQLVKPKSSKEVIEEGRNEDVASIDKKIEKAKKDELPKREIESLQKQKEDINKYYDNQLELLPKDIAEVDKAKELYPLTDNTEQDASTVRSDQGQVQETGTAPEGSQNQGGENLQSSSEPAPVNAETQQQVGGEEVVINTPEDFESELTKIFSDENKPEAISADAAMGDILPDTQRPVENKKPKAPAKEKKTKPALDKAEQSQADYAYQNTYRFFKQKYPDVDVDEYNRLRAVKRDQALPKLGEINKNNNVRDKSEDTTQYTPQSIIQKAKEFYKNDPLINRVISFLEPIIKANPNIKIDSSFNWDSPQYEGQNITNQALGYSFPSGNVILNFNRISDYDTLFRTALHELVHAATRSEINTNKAFNEDLKNVLADVRRAMKLPEGDSVVEALIRNKVISEDYDTRYGAANEHELLAEVFTNQKFSDFLKGLEYKGDNLLHRLFLTIAKFFSKKYKALINAKENISVDNIADYLMGLTESVISGQQELAEGGNALPALRPGIKEVLKKTITKAREKNLSEQIIRDKLKQIGNLSDQEIDELLDETPLPPLPVAPGKVLTPTEIGQMPSEVKRKSALRKFKEKYFDRAKGLPDWILKLKDRAKGTVHLEVRQALQLVEKTRETAKKIGFDDWDLFDKALRNQYYGSDLADLRALPPEMQVMAVQMRNKIDGLSRDLIINNYVTPEQALNIESNIGEYMTRSYRAFNEKDWSKKVPTKAREDAYRLLVQQRFDELMDENKDEIANGNITEDELIETAKADAFKDLQSIIDGISDKYTPPKINVQKGKDLGILKQRQDIPKEIREVLGEYTDPGVNFAMTVARVASIKSSAEYLNSVKKEGLGEIFFEADSRPPEASVEIKAEGSQTWNPLNGLYTTPEVKEIFDETEVIRNKFVQMWLKGVGAVKWGKTVGSLVTQVKNFESNLGFAIMNGHYRAGKSGESFKFLKDKLFGGEKSQDEMIEKVIRLGIVDQSIGVRELKDMFATDNLDKVIVNSSIIEKSPIRKLGDTLIGRPIKYLNKVYGASDDFWKVYGFLNEAESLAKSTYNTSYKNLTEDQQSSVDVEASERVKNIYPTYDRVWEGAKSISKGLPVFGNFLSFRAESIRVLLNTFSYAIQDLKTPDRKLMGAQRLAGIGAYLGARTLILYTISQMTGVGMAGLLGMASDDDEDQKLKDINRYAPEFIRSGDKLATDHGDGKYTVYDVGSLEPYGVWFKTMNAFNEGNDIVKDGGLAASATELLSPFIEPEMSFKMFLNLYNNENDFGSRIYNPMDGGGDKTLDAMEFIIKKAKPSTIDLIQRLYKKEDKTNEVSAIFGGRGYEMDIAKSFSFKLKAAEELFDANRDAMNKIKYNPDSTPEQITEAEKVFEERTNKVIKMLSEDYQAAIRLGTKIDNLDESLDRKKFFQGYNKNVKNQIKSGVVEEGKQSSDEIKEWQP